MIATDLAQKLRTRLASSGSIWTCGVILPLAAILVEALTAFCANFIDPIPTLWHLGLLLAVPWCNAAAWLALRRDAFERRRFFAATTGFSAAVSLFYTVLFVPIMPFAVVGLLVGLPILAFAPVLSFLSALKLARAWRGFAGTRAILCGAGLGFAAILWLALPAVAVRAGASMMQSEHPWLRETGFRVLRLDAVRQDLLKACYIRSSAGARESVALLAGRGPLQLDEARALYYRATGSSYEREPATFWHRRAWLSFDEHRGSDTVGPVAHAVRLAASRVDGSLDPRSAVAYLEWTLAFHNTSATQQEARMEIGLPPGAAVTRATLWIHGAEREAAFGERARVRQAYEKVVRVRRDPLLVTTAGRGRVLVQCFPIEPGRDMQIRIGVTAPLVPDGVSDRGILSLPVLLDRNFDAAEPSWIWLESKAPIAASAAALHITPREDGVQVMRGSLAPGERPAIRVSGLEWRTVWAQENPDRIVEQRFAERATNRRSPLVIVVDGSESLRPIRRELEAALAHAPGPILVATRAGVEPWPSTTSWQGGVESLPALQQAADRGSVLWIAGEQPVSSAQALIVRQMLERSRGRTQLYILSTGSNAVLRELDGAPGVEAIPRLGSVAEDLRRLFTTWQAQSERVVERQLKPATPAPPESERGSPHIVRLWTADHPTVALAVAHQVVTPLTGAVVLETAAQYAENGLQPASPSTVPTMPEPETVGLLAVGLAVAAWLRWRRRPCAS